MEKNKNDNEMKKNHRNSDVKEEGGNKKRKQIKQ
jgi:hypothetical protein